MKAATRLALSMALSLFVLASGAWTATFPVEKVARSVVQLWIPEVGGGCSAVALGSDHFVTAAHCTELITANEFTMTVFNKPVQVIETSDSEDGDIAVVRSIGAVNVPPIKIGPQPKRGDNVLVMGYIGKRPGLTFFPALVVDLEAPEWHGRMILAGVSGAGMSGGAIVDTQGRLVGIHQGWMDPTERNRQGLLTYASHYPQMRKLLDKYTK